MCHGPQGPAMASHGVVETEPRRARLAIAGALALAHALLVSGCSQSGNDDNSTVTTTTGVTTTSQFDNRTTTTAAATTTTTLHQACAVLTSNDCSGNDVEQHPAFEWWHCCEMCSSHVNCHAWTHDARNIDDRTCYLKTACPSISRADAGLTSGVVAGRHCDARGGCACDCSKYGFSSDACNLEYDDGSCCWGCCCTAPPTTTTTTTTTSPPCALQQGLECLNGDLWDTHVDGIDDCCDLCREVAECTDFTFALYSADGRPRCYLKTGCDGFGACGGCTYGHVSRDSIGRATTV